MSPKYVSDCVKSLLKLTVFLMFVFSTSSTKQCTPKKTERDNYIIKNVGIKLCQLKCDENGECLSIEYNSDTLTCRLSNVVSTKIKKKEGYVILAREHSRVPTGACASKKCSFGQRCLETRSGKAVCVQDEKQNYPDKSPQHKVDKLETTANNPLHEACRKGNLDRVGLMLSQGLVDINSRDEKHGRTPLMVAAKEGHCKIFAFLISKGANISEVDNDSKNALHWACKGGHVSMFKCVLQQYNIKTNAGETPPLVQAAFGGNGDLFEFLVCMGANLSVHYQGNNVLHWACTGGHVSIVRYLITQRHVDINSRGLHVKTPLMIAVFFEHRDVFELLMRMGANVSHVDVNGNNVLHIACDRGQLDMVKYLVTNSSVDINGKTKEGMTPLMVAVLRRRRYILDFLVNMGANMSLVDIIGRNILHLASAGGSIEMVKYILSKNLIDINARDNLGATAALIAKRTGNLNVYNLLVSRAT